MPVIPTPSMKLTIDHMNSAIEMKRSTIHVNKAALFNATPINSMEVVINLDPSRGKAGRNTLNQKRRMLNKHACSHSVEKNPCKLEITVRYLRKVKSDTSPSLIAAYMPNQNRLIGICISTPPSAILISSFRSPLVPVDSSPVDNVDRPSQKVYPPNGQRTIS
mmetsp:Transcript_36032/g.77668  ORF Transcript_36032/g.77668 Transcript_36032/m.77668 type:complete len:163 (-) Transcript_36032:350-838(-)